ncbi:unnamed protein product [Closterium sp. NIES-64]|nr:unnamed protein product [Closterium sp. NIES-64]
MASGDTARDAGMQGGGGAASGKEVAAGLVIAHPDDESMCAPPRRLPASPPPRLAASLPSRLPASPPPRLAASLPSRLPASPPPLLPASCLPASPPPLLPASCLPASPPPRFPPPRLPASPPSRLPALPPARLSGSPPLSPRTPLLRPASPRLTSPRLRPPRPLFFVPTLRALVARPSAVGHLVSCAALPQADSIQHGARCALHILCLSSGAPWPAVRFLSAVDSPLSCAAPPLILSSTPFALQRGGAGQHEEGGAEGSSGDPRDSPAVRGGGGPPAAAGVVRGGEGRYAVLSGALCSQVRCALRCAVVSARRLTCFSISVRPVPLAPTPLLTCFTSTMVDNGSLPVPVWQLVSGAAGECGSW